MGFVKLGSFENAESLQRAMETASVARVARGKLKVDDVMGMDEQDTISAFSLIRWADTKGIPKCPKCQSTDTYTLAKRNVWKCVQCSHQFSLTSSTMLSSHKMGFGKYLALLSILIDKSQFRSLLQFSNETKIGYKTVWEQINRLRACTTDSKGCTVPFSLLSKDAWALRHAAIRSNLTRYIAMPAQQNYPYLSEVKKELDGADLLMFVNRLVPRWVPDHMRADICQDMIVAILTGETTRDKMSKDSKKFLTKVFQDFPWKYKWMSFDAPRNDEDDRTLHDMLSEEAAGDHFNRVHR